MRYIEICFDRFFEFITDLCDLFEGQILLKIDMGFKKDLFVVELPDMDVVDVVQCGVFADGFVDLFQIDMRRGELHQDHRGIFEDTIGGIDKVDGDQDRDQRIDPEEFEIVHGNPAGQDRDGGHDIGDQMKIGGTDVDVVVGIIFDQQNARGIEDNAQNGQGDDDDGTDGFGVDEFLNGFDDEKKPDPDQHRGIEERRKYLGALETEGLGLCGGTSRHAVGDVTDEQGHDITEVMQGVAQKSERTGVDAADDLRKGNDDV